MAFALSKILWEWVSPGSLLTFLLVLGLILNSIPHPGSAKFGKVLSIIATLCFLCIAVLPVGEWALTPLENRFTFDPPDQVDGIIILGGDEQTNITEARGIPTALDSMRRYWMFADLARRYPDAKLIFSGGSGFLHPDAIVLDSEVARELMNDMGVPTDRMIFETASRNTYENAVLTADIVRPEPSQKWILVTSAWHMPRAMGCFRKAGWNVYPAPTGYYTTGRYREHFFFRFDEQIRLLTIAVHEYVGLVAYWFMGRTSALWPS